MSELIKRGDNGGSVAQFKGFFAACDTEALVEACAASDDERLQAWAQKRTEAECKRFTDLYIARQCQVTLKLISQAYLDYRREQGMVELANRIPQAMADIGDDALSKRRKCPKCAGQGIIKVEGQELECEECWGLGILVKSGDPDARKAMLEAAKITGQKSPLLAQQFNFDGGFSVEGMITQGEKMMGGK